MGNCYGAPVNNHSPSKPPTLVTSRTITKQNGIAEWSWRRKASGINGNKINGILTGRSASKAAVIVSRSSSNNININITETAAGSAAAHDDDAVLLAPNERLMVRSAPKVLKEFTLAELKKATRDFRPDTILGEGGFGRVFKGWIDEETYAPSRVGIGMAVAVKKSSTDSYQGHQEWQAEVDFLGKYHHPNLVRLLGHCCEENQFLLVYEYMPKGSLENHLFRKGQQPLPWETRLKIAIGAARGLAYLHTSEKVIYRDFKASNILLDSDFNAKLSDFGLAKLGPLNGNSHVTTRIIGTYGYAAPEYIATGHLYVKSDVYGFGVVLLEILTGLRALDNNRPVLEQSLVDWARPSLHKKKELKKMMDPGLGEQYPLKAACQAAELILKCLESEPKNRPSMEEVLVILEKVNSIKEKPKSTKSANGRRHEEHSSAHQHPYRSPNHRKHGGNIGVGSQPRVY